MSYVTGTIFIIIWTIYKFYHIICFKSNYLIRPNFEEVAGELHKLGATLVIKEEDLRSNSTRELVKNLGSPVRLALNCVGGKSASGITRLLG